MRTFRSVECVGDLFQRDRLLGIQFEIDRLDEFLVTVRIALDGLFMELDKAAFNERAQSLIVERGLSEELRRGHGRLQLRNRFEQFGLSWRAFF